MNVQNVKMNSIYNNRNKKETSFKATPAQMMESLKKTTPSNPGKKLLFEILTNLFTDFENSYRVTKELPNNFEYKLLEPNSYSKNMAKLKAKGHHLNFKKFDHSLKKGKFLNYDSSKTRHKVLLSQILKEQGVEKTRCYRIFKIKIAKIIVNNCKNNCKKPNKT